MIPSVQAMPYGVQPSYGAAGYAQGYPSGTAVQAGQVNIFNANNTVNNFGTPMPAQPYPAYGMPAQGPMVNMGIMNGSPSPGMVNFGIVNNSPQYPAQYPMFGQQQMPMQPQYGMPMQQPMPQMGQPGQFDGMLHQLMSLVGELVRRVTTGEPIQQPVQGPIQEVEQYPADQYAYDPYSYDPYAYEPYVQDPYAYEPYPVY